MMAVPVTSASAAEEDTDNVQKEAVPAITKEIYVMDPDASHICPVNFKSPEGNTRCGSVFSGEGADGAITAAQWMPGRQLFNGSATAAETGGKDLLLFRLTGTISSAFNDTDHFYYRFCDHYGEWFRRIENVTVCLQRGKEAEITDITAYADISFDEKTHTMYVVFEDLKRFAPIDTENGKVIVCYTAQLSRKAKTGGKGNVNEAWIDFGGKADGTGVRSTKKTYAKAFTWSVCLRKTNETGNIFLKDAQFVIRDGAGLFVNTDGTLSEKQQAASLWKTNEKGEFLVRKLASGEYYFSEIKAPDGCGLLPEFSVHIQADVSDPDNPVLSAECRFEKEENEKGDVRIAQVDAATGQILVCAADPDRKDVEETEEVTSPQETTFRTENDNFSTRPSVTPVTSNSPTKATVHLPKTGDSQKHLFLWILLLAAGIGLCVFCIHRLMRSVK